MIEIGRIRLERSAFRERALAIGVRRCIAGEFVLDERDDERVEPARTTVGQLEIDLLPRQFGDQRPGGIAMQKERTIVRIDEIVSVVADPKRKIRRPRSRSRCEYGKRHNNGAEDRLHPVI